MDVAVLRQLLARPRPPVEFCTSECGSSGPILGTIHASKGRQANNVILFLPQGRANQEASASVAEARVVYVGATRARATLQVGSGKPCWFKSPDGRAFSRKNKSRVQFELGSEGDFVSESPVSTKYVPTQESAREVQTWLASGVAHAMSTAALRWDKDPVDYLLTAHTSKGDIVVGGLSPSLVWDLRKIVSTCGGGRKAPAYVNHIVIYGVRTVVLSKDDPVLDQVHAPYQQSGFFLAPLVKALTTVSIGSPRRQQ
jgi:hypothetical protein